MTTFQHPLKAVGPNGLTGDPTTNTESYVRSMKVIPLGPGAASRQIVTIPANSTILAMGGTATSAFAADVSACNVNFGTSAQVSRYGLISVSALGLVRNVVVSASTDFDAQSTIIVTLSAVGTTTFSSGGARAFIEFVTTE